jgi:hypothetical protein
MCWVETFAIGNPQRLGLLAEITSQIRESDEASRHLEVRQPFNADRKERLTVHHVAEAPQLGDVRGIYYR